MKATFICLPALFCCVAASAQFPFRFPTANTNLFVPGAELKFFAPTEADKPWTSGGFGCVRDNGWRMHEGLDIRHLQTDRRGEPADPIMAAADGTVVYFSDRPGLSNYGNYIVIRHVIEGIEIYSVYAHLSAIAPGLKVGEAVKAGDVIATMGRTSDTGWIPKWRAHVHFELNVFFNDRFAIWFKKNFRGERNDHGQWNGLNLFALDERDIFLQERALGPKFSLLNYIRNQTALCRVIVRAAHFPYLKRYPMLVTPNPVAQKQGVAGYEMAINYNGVPFALMPLAASEIKGRARFQLVSVNEAVEKANPCRRLVVKRRGHWELANEGIRLLDLLTF
ncbi:MAG: M23 family metallopeptidase [Verrucomicrobia bacterium]|nr:M23 family metallopeptidase [Verrucomicrobiota bacterium]MDE3099618.1 M23 family metallopeptidase [Verrucomicrobiota bacterium]